MTLLKLKKTTGDCRQKVVATLKKRVAEMWKQTTFAGTSALAMNAESAGFQVMEGARPQRETTSQ